MNWMYKLGAALVLLLLIIAGVFKGVDAIGDARERKVVEQYRVQISAQNREAERKLAEATAKVALTEASLSAYRTAQEKTDAQNTKTNNDLRAKLLASVSGSAGRLRDPYAQTACRSSGGDTQSKDTASTDNSSGDPAETGGFLSAEITGLLFDEAEKNDTINNAYASCREDSFRVRETLNSK